MKRTFRLLYVLLFFFPFYAKAGEISWETAVKARPITANHINSISVDPKKINLNTANKEQLTTLYGIGPKKADMIIAYRVQYGPFKKISDLLTVKGLGKKVAAKIIEKNKNLLEIDERS